MDRRRARTRHRLRRRQPDHRRHAVHGLPVVGRTAGQAADRRPASRAAARRPKRWIWVASRAAGQFPDELGRQALFRRRRTGAMDRDLPAFDGDLGPRAPIAVHPRRLVVRSARRHLGVQCRPAARPAAGLYRARSSTTARRSGCRPATSNASTSTRRCSGRPLPVTDPPAWLTSLGRIADPNLARPLSAAG